MCKSHAESQHAASSDIWLAIIAQMILPLGVAFVAIILIAMVLGVMGEERESADKFVIWCVCKKMNITSDILFVSRSDVFYFKEKNATIWKNLCRLLSLKLGMESSYRSCSVLDVK